MHIVSAPGSGKTTVAAERYGFQRFSKSDPRGVLGLTFNRAAAAELLSRTRARWGSGCVRAPHEVITFDHLHVRILQRLLADALIHWPNGHTRLDVRDDYRGLNGFRFLKPPANYRRVAGLDESRKVVSIGLKVDSPTTGIGTRSAHQELLAMGIASHEDVRAVLVAAMTLAELREQVAGWLSSSFRSVIIDEVYDASSLDILIAYLAAGRGLSVTLIGDPWQALYKWRGAEPEVVHRTIAETSDQFVEYEQTQSFRFVGEQMPRLASDLRRGVPVTLPTISSNEVDVALARHWGRLWSVGDNVLPLAFRTVDNKTDASLNLLLDVVTRSRLGVTSFGREGAIAKLGLNREIFLNQQDQVFEPILADLRAGLDASVAIDLLRDAVSALGARRPNKLKEDSEADRVAQLAALSVRLRQSALVPGLTVFQAKGREWDRVGVVLSGPEEELLASGLQKLDDDSCGLYVAITRARRLCGQLQKGSPPLLDLDPDGSVDL